MKLTKEGQRVWDKLKAEGLTDEEIFERVPIFPHEYESEEEREEDRKLLAQHIAAARAKRTPEEQNEIDEFVKQLKNEK